MSERRRDSRPNNGEDESRDRSRSPQQRPTTDTKKKLKNLGIQMKLAPQKPETKPKVTVASAFNQDSDEEPEEMPPQARMRMKNIGRDTPTSSGPNSFGKTKQGFSDSSKIFEKSLNKNVEQPK